MNIDGKFEQLKDALGRDNENDVQQSMWLLSAVANDWSKIPDEVVERLLSLLQDDEMYTSPYAGHLLNVFEFESNKLTDHQKWLCVDFLNAYGDQFRDVHSRQVVTELRYGLYSDYLKMKKPNPQQWKDYQRMRGELE